MSRLEAHIVASRGDFVVDVECSTGPGETIAVLGPNGAGKSTLVAALAGIVPLDRGHIQIDGRVLEDPERGVRVTPRDRDIGVLFQGLHLFPSLTVLDNVTYGLVARGADRQAARDRALGLLERLDVAQLSDRQPQQLSGGEAQRVALARALAPSPSLLLLDEPLSAQDAEARGRARHVLRDLLLDFAGASLIVTHDPLEALTLGDRVIVIEGGKTVQSGAAESLRRRPATRYVAALAGVNIANGMITRSDSGVFLEAGQLKLAVSGGELESGSQATAVIPPTAIVLMTEVPHTSARNIIDSTIATIDRLADRARVSLSTTPPLTAEITLESLSEMALAEGAPILAAIKATEIAVYPD